MATATRLLTMSIVHRLQLGGLSRGLNHRSGELFWGFIRSHTGEDIDLASNITGYTADISIGGKVIENVELGRPSSPPAEMDVEIHAFPPGTLIIGVKAADFLIWGALSGEREATGPCGETP